MRENGRKLKKKKKGAKIAFEEKKNSMSYQPARDVLTLITHFIDN